MANDNKNNDFLGLVEDLIPYHTERDQESLEFDIGASDYITITRHPNSVNVDILYTYGSKENMNERQITSLKHIEKAMSNLFDDHSFFDDGSEFHSVSQYPLLRGDLKEAHGLVAQLEPALKKLGELPNMIEVIYG